MADHDTHDHTGITGVGATDHGALTGLSDDDHPQYIKDSEFGAKGRILVGTGSGTFDDLPAGTNGHILTLDSGEATGVKWAANAGAADILDLPTVETDTSLVLAPDGAGGVEFRAEVGGGSALTLLHTVTLGSAAASIGQSGISGAYKDLIIVAKLRGTASAEVIDSRLRVGNGSVDTGSNYADQSQFFGSSSGSQVSSSVANIYIGPHTAGTSTAGLFSAMRLEILDYAATSVYRFVNGEGAHFSSSRFIIETRGIWKNNAAAIDIISLFPDSGNFDTGSRLYIYGRG